MRWIDTVEEDCKNGGAWSIIILYIHYVYNVYCILYFIYDII